MVLDWLTKGLGKKPTSSHPLGTSDSVQEIVESLTASNPARLVGEVGDWIAPAEKTGLSLSARATAYARLTEAAQHAIDELWFDVLAAPVGEARAEHAWFALLGYTRSVLGSFYDLARDSVAAKENGLDKKTMTLLLARAMHAAVAHKKLLRMRYRFVETVIWTETYWLYVYAEAQGIARTPVKVYPKREPETSVHREFVAGMMFEMAPLGNIEPHQMESLDLIIRKYDTFFAFRESRDAETLFYVDLARNQWPDRLLPGLGHKSTMRYFGVGLALGHVTQLLKEVVRAREIPAWLVLPGEQDIDNCVALLRKLIAHWSKEPPTRQHKRARQESAINVLHGFSQIRRMIAGIAYLKSGKKSAYVSSQELFEMQRHGFANEKRLAPKPEAAGDAKDLLKKMELAGDKEMMQNWSLYDASETGIGAIAVQHSEWLRIGALVGFRYEDQMDWSIGIVRRLSRNAQNQTVVGLELFKGEPDCARAGSLDKREQSVWDTVLEAGIFGWQDAMVLAGASTMLLGPGTYSDGRRFKITVGSVKFFVKLTELIESGSDFELVRYAEYTPDETTALAAQTQAGGGFSDATND